MKKKVAHSKKRRVVKKRRKQKKVFIWAGEKTGLGSKRDVIEIERVWSSLKKRGVIS